jgi:hypothetical protein
MLQFIYFIIGSIFSHSYARPTFCGDFTHTTGTTACTSSVLPLALFSSYDDLTLFPCFLPEEVLLTILAYVYHPISQTAYSSN